MSRPRCRRLTAYELPNRYYDVLPKSCYSRVLWRDFGRLLHHSEGELLLFDEYDSYLT